MLRVLPVQAAVASSRCEQQHASLQEQLSAVQAELANTQLQLQHVSTHLVGAAEERAALQQQLEHLGVKVRDNTLWWALLASLMQVLD